MKTFWIYFIIFFGSFINSFGQNTPNYTLEETWHLYDSLILKTNVSSIEWSGKVETCTPGSIPSDLYLKAEKRINFFRLMNHLPTLKLNPDFNHDAQSAALLIKANHKVTHTPSAKMKCYSSSAANGCKKSCLGLTSWTTFKRTAFILGFYEDWGDVNYYVGHRRWLLYSRLKSFGYGATDESEVIYTVDGIDRKDTFNIPDYTAYPWNGYVPIDIVFSKWSFSIPDKNKVDFSQATISMYDETNKKVKITRLNEFKNFLDHTIVWVPNELFTENEIKKGQNLLEQKGYKGKSFRIEIKNVLVNGVMKSYEYKVTLI